jgi:predicted ATPase
MAQLLREGLELAAGLTVLMGENGSGKSTVIETLSFTALLGLAALLHDLAEAGSQIVVATHSPIPAAIPGASPLGLGPWGIQPATWDDLGLVVSWRQFMRDPQFFFRHLW